MKNFQYSGFRLLLTARLSSSLFVLTGSPEADKISREVTEQTPQRPDDGGGQASSVSTCTSLRTNS